MRHALPLVGIAMTLAGCAENPFRISPGSPELHGPVGDWPRPIPLRLKPDGRDELLVLTLGDVQTPLAQGTFDPVADRVTLADGRTIENYYKSVLKVPHFRPLDKSVFPVPPSGWCSWYYYYQEVTPEEVLVNARWIAANLAEHGARYVQLDDGWQGTGHGLGDNRDWSTIDERFRGRTMAGLATQIRALGLEAGIWIAPHGQSNEAVARGSDAFLFTRDGKSASDTWEGTFLLDPTAARAAEYLRDLFGRIRSWGFSYFKIDGQPIVIDEYSKRAAAMRGPLDSAEPDDARAERLYRQTLTTIRESIGRDSYLLGCWGIPLPGIGIMNGSRTAGDVVLGWDGFLVANDAVQRWNFLHNVAWYCDPDVMTLRPPLSAGVARAWATIQGLSGQALMTSDRLPDLPASRLAMLHRVYPAVDVRPLDLYRPDNVRKPIWDLKVSHLGRQYDVLAAFNYDEKTAQTRLVTWQSLGLDPAKAYHVYDFWNDAYLGAWPQGVFIETPPADVRVLTLVPESDRPVLIGTSRHITQGWVELLALTENGTSGAPRLEGRSRVIPGEPYRLVLGLPRSKHSFRVSRVRVGPGGALRGAPEIQNGTGFATVTLDLAGPAPRELRWTIELERSEAYVFPVHSPSSIQARSIGLGAVELTWEEQYHARVGYQVSIDRQALGVAFENRAVLRDLRPGQNYKIAVASTWFDGSVSEKPAEAQVKIDQPSVVELSDLTPEHQRQDWGKLGRDRSVSGGPLTVAKETFTRGLGTHTESVLAFRVYGAYERFTGRVGVDDGAKSPKPGEVIFQISGDRRMLWDSGVTTFDSAARPFDVSIRGVQLLELRALPGVDGIDYGHADWLEPRLSAANP
ncbi:MAG: NPCBM/NEW2 domain-containing protein [Phycisphaerae bacterium]